MVFSLGNLLVLGIVLVILAVFRRTDVNSRSLEKVRKYADKAREELDAVVLEKVQNLKDLSIELDVHQKAAKEILKRSQGIEDGIGDKFAATETIAARIKEYDRVLDELVGMTRRAEENIGRIKEESEFTDSVAKKLRAVETRLEEQEGRIPEVVAKFGELNDASLRSAQDAVMDSASLRVEDMGRKIDAAAAKADQVALFMKTTEAETRRGADRIRLDLEELGGRLVEKISGDLSRIEADYDARLEAAATRGEALETKALAKLRDFFEEKMKAVSREYAVRLDQGKKDLDRKLEELGSVVEGVRIEAERDREAIKAENAAAAGEFTSRLKEKIDDLEGSLYESERVFQEKLAAAGEKSEGLVEAMVSRIGREIEEKAGALRAGAELDGRRLREEAAAQKKKVEDMFGSLKERTEAWSAKFEASITGIAEKIKSFEAGVAGYERDLGARTNAAVKLFEAAEGSLRDRTGEISSRAEALQAEASEALAALKESVGRETRNMDAAVRSFLQENEKRIAEAGESLQSRVVGELDARLADYEKNISYRFTRIEEVSGEVDTLEKTMRETMDRLSARLREDFAEFGRDLHAKRLSDREELENSTRELRNGMDELERGLADLKTRAYDNVSEKLKIFEDEFFRDLGARDEAMQEKFNDWQSRIDGSLGELAKKNAEERERIENRFTEELKERFGEFSGRFVQQLAALEEESAEARRGVSARLEESAAAFEDFRKEVRADLEEAKAGSDSLVRDELQRYGAVLDGETARFRKDYEARLKALADELEERKRDLSGTLEGVKSDVTVWQARVLQDLAASEAEVDNRFAGFKVTISDTVSALRDEFSAQKNELILSTQDERSRLKEELRVLGEGAASLREDLHRRTSESQEELRSLHGEFRDEFVRKNKDLQAEADGKIRDFRAIIQDTRQQFETLNGKLFGRIEESAKLLSVNLAEIEKRQKSFVEQTKIFERADALKISLGESIEELKADMARVDSQHKDMKELESQILKVRKLGEEVSEKMSRFTAEKRRIDALESDYGRLIGMSDAVEQKLRQITATDDGITAIQASLRGLETLQQETEARFDRLEKKKKILDVTAEGVDKNFALLGEIEKRLASFQRELAEVPGGLESLQDRVARLAEGKAKADEAVERLAEIDATMKDLEKRMAHLQKIREWLAKTETRIEEVSRSAQEQVKLLGTLLKDGARAAKKEKGAPSMSARETVTKLAHQGWTVEQIAMATKLSRGEVELILELTAK